MKPEDCLRLQMSDDQMTASCYKTATINEQTTFTRSEILLFLEKSNINFGVKEDVLQKLTEQPRLVSFPLVLAEGTKPTKGEAAYLLPVEQQQGDQIDERLPKNLRNVTVIPMAVQGEVIGKKIAATRGAEGKTVTGRVLPGMVGHDFVLRNGKNTTVQDNKIIASVSGQMSIEGKRIHVFPVYEVNGDLSLETGNIAFNGNVVIRGSVPAGYEIKADGDVRVTGIVEGATIQAGGSVYIGKGIAAQGKGSVTAEYDVQCEYINQGVVTAGNNIMVTQSIIHSRVDAGHSLFCYKGRGNVIGGKCSAGRYIHVRESGNQLNTPTSLYIGLSEQRLTKEIQSKEMIKAGKSELAKLQKLKTALAAKELKQGSLDVKDRVLLLRIRSSIEDWLTKIYLAHDKVSEIEEQDHVYNDSVRIVVDKLTHMNTVAHFGKYRRSVTKDRKSVTFRLHDGEIVIQT
ncbi:DUF342 domain-containing protein [Geomicrobium sediminis]|uniref:Uncharacterized protein (DUF342 family) n=1 Tax=Geomicrobium sediminis TaxID=1347788 RepID=A0ABS2PB34_9BACL|nr:FapA family protein [Geomicrobium sediminis]MBM7632615.1 uncharacterized protein (DUF342 family) [Geomicrobium sediminis]